uniref:alpha/beta fold hydrolase n=1 Tax=uncultured Sphingomonas sp. TaxID=158754 RepID=UPI0035CA20EB
MPYTDTASPIYYETSGPASGTPLVLIEGLGAQLIGWRDDFVDRLVAQGLFVIRLDNRDVGLSAKFGAAEGAPPPYALGDMADDVCAVLDTLGLASAHIVGQSMGGAIAQLLAIHHPARVRSMVLFYTVPSFTPAYLTDEVLQRLVAAPPMADDIGRADFIEAFVESQRFCGSSGFAFDEAWVRTLGARSYDRCDRVDGAGRQTAAMLGAADRGPHLARLDLPVALIHGRGDRLLKYQASIDMAALIPDAELHLYPGMGHQIVEDLWDDFIAIILRTIGRRHGPSSASD